MTADPHWTQYLSALLTPTVAVLGAFIAYQQWRVAQNRLKFDLYDRGFSVYEAARNLLASIMTSGKAKDEEVFNYVVATSEARWLFDASVGAYLGKELYHKVLDLQTLVAELEGEPVGDKRTRNIRAQAEIKKWLRDQYSVLDGKFTPYLVLRH